MPMYNKQILEVEANKFGFRRDTLQQMKSGIWKCLKKRSTCLTKNRMHTYGVCPSGIFAD